MGLHHRQLLTDCELFCHAYCSSNCDGCIKNCTLNDNPSPPSPPIFAQVDVNEHSKHHTISTYLIIIFAVVATAFFGVCCYVIYAKFFTPRNRSRRRILSQQETQENHDQFLDEEHGPTGDHPIWYIRATGLHQSVITAITVCKYKRGEGLIEGTECSVCLSEFQEDENLRLLPKCNHAFHLPCIDTWLRSHTNCPMCRAPIVTNPARIPSMELEPNVVDSSSMENSQMESLENSGGGGGSGMENSDDVLRNGAEEEGQLEVEDERRVCETESSDAEVVNMQPRRSVSLDSSSAAKINLALAAVLSVESHGNNETVVSKRVAGNENLAVATSAKGSSSSRIRYLQSAPSSMKRSRSFNGKHLPPWYSRSQKKSNAPVRSF